MKKFFAIAIIATAFVACNNSADKKNTPDTPKVEDKMAPVEPVTPKNDTVITGTDTLVTVKKADGTIDTLRKK